MMQHLAEKLVIRTLDNGLHVLVLPTTIVPRVSVQLWYNVGSKHEKRGQKGMAHFLEHMLFKGTKILSEVDMIQITHKLSGSCNAFTSQDYTGYMFDFPKNQWQISLEMLADSMQNCTFKQELLDSELGAVIQEIKLYKDDYESILEEEMTAAIFDQHPYHYPVLGYKHELWSASRQDMLDFYHKYYAPNNASLIIVGDVDPVLALQDATLFFNNLKPNAMHAKSVYYAPLALATKSITLHRDIQQPLGCVAFRVSGLSTKNSYLLTIMSWLVAEGKGSRLYKKLVDELRLVTDIETSMLDCFEHGIFFIRFQFDAQVNFDDICNVISSELAQMTEYGFSDAEMMRAYKQTETEYIDLFEDNQELAHEIARLFVATGDPAYAFSYIDEKSVSAETIKTLLETYVRPALMHRGRVIPIAARDQEYFISLQEVSDQEDDNVLQGRLRTSALEVGSYLHTIEARPPLSFIFPTHTTFELSNGCKVIYSHNATLPTIELILSFKAQYYYDPEELQGLYTIVTAMLLEGTEKYTAQQLAAAFEVKGMSIDALPGGIAISLLRADLELALELLNEILCRPQFSEQSLVKIKEQLSAHIKDMMDDSFASIDQYAKEAIYKHHPYSKNSSGTLESIARITCSDVMSFYKQYIVPSGAIFAVVGDLEGYDVPGLVATHVEPWQGGVVSDLYFPTLTPGSPTVLEYPMQRDQIALCFTRLSVSRYDAAYDPLLVVNEILTGGQSGAMSSRLFQLREQTGLFYTIQGSLCAYAEKEPGMMYVKTLVSRDRMVEAEHRIKEVIDRCASTITQTDVATAKRSLINGLPEHVASNSQRAQAFIFIERMRLPVEYLNIRAQALANITQEQIIEQARNILQSNCLYTIRVGRV